MHTPEHVIAAALGGELTTDGFCADCNEQFGKEIDAPLAQFHWIQELRHRYGVKDRYGKVPPAPRIDVTVDGEAAVVTMGANGWELEVFPKEEISGDKVHMRVPAEREDEIIPKKLARLERKFGNVELTDRRAESSQPTAEFSETWSLNLWARAAAKIALGIGSCLDAWEWRESPAGVYVAALAASGIDAAGTPPADGGVSPLPRVCVGDDLIAKAIVAPRHFVWIDESGYALGIVLFGQFQLAARLGAKPPAKNVAWLFDPVARKYESGAYSAIFGGMILELNKREGSQEL